MSDQPSVVKVVTSDGTVHWTAPGSPAAQRMHPAGEQQTEGVISDGAETAAAGDDHDTAGAGGGSGDGTGVHPAPARRQRRPGKAEPAPSG